MGVYQILCKHNHPVELSKSCAGTIWSEAYCPICHKVYIWDDLIKFKM
jgi:hypothetical protein